MNNGTKNEKLKYWRIQELEETVECLENMFGERIEKYKTGKNYYDILIRAYAHSLIVMKEIICLLNNGFPDGALARARRLYEQMIIINFFESRKTDIDFNELVERYFDSQNISAYSNQIKLYDFFGNKNEKIMAEKEINVLKNKYASFYKGKNHMQNYWWIGDENLQSFGKLQNRYNDPYGKILYSRACISTHAGAMGDYALLGRSNPHGEKIYTGETYSGYSLPLILGTLSFYNVTNMVFKNLQIIILEEYKKIHELLDFYQTTIWINK